MRPRLHHALHHRQTKLYDERHMTQLRVLICLYMRAVSFNKPSIRPSSKPLANTSSSVRLIIPSSSSAVVSPSISLAPIEKKEFLLKVMYLALRHPGAPTLAGG